MAFLSSTLDTCQRACPAKQAQEIDVEIATRFVFSGGFSASVKDNKLILVILLLGVDCGACLEVGIHDWKSILEIRGCDFD